MAHRRRRDRQRHPGERRRTSRPGRRAVRRDRRRRVGARHRDVADARRRRPADGARPATRPLRAPDLALAPVLLAAEGRLDHRAADERRRRALRRPQPGPDDARRQHADAHRRDRRAVPARLAPRSRRPPRAPARDADHAVVPADVARGVLGRPHADLGGDGAARRVGRRHGGRAGVQPRAGLPARVRGPERGEPDLEHLRAEALVGVLSGDRAARRDRAGRGDLRRRADDRRRRARDRHAHRRGRHALARLPAAPGALRALRAGAGRERGHGEDLDRPRRRAGHHRPARTPASSIGSTAVSSSTGSCSRTARSR